MKSIRILKETTDHWKCVSAGTVIAMMNDEDADSVIKNGEGELVDQGTATSLHLREISDKLMDIEQNQQFWSEQLQILAETVNKLAIKYVRRSNE